jgi:hypothetical protein
MGQAFLPGRTWPRYPIIPPEWTFPSEYGDWALITLSEGFCPKCLHKLDVRGWCPDCLVYWYIVPGGTLDGESLPTTLAVSWCSQDHPDA